MSISSISYQYNDGMTNVCKLPNTYSSKGFSNMLSYAKTQSYNTIILAPSSNVNYFELILCNVSGSTLYMYNNSGTQGIVMSDYNPYFVWVSSSGSSYENNTGRSVSLSNTSAYNKTYKTLQISDGRCIVISSIKFTKVYLNNSEVTIPMPDIIFPMSGPLAHSGNDYSISPNMFTFTTIIGYADVWHSIELSGENNFKTTVLSGNWTSIDNNYADLTSGTTITISSLGTNMKSKFIQVLNGEIETYTVFDETDFKLSFKRGYNSSYNYYYITAHGSLPYSDQVMNQSLFNIRNTNIGNYDGVYLTLYFNRNPAKSSKNDYLWIIGSQSESYTGLSPISIASDTSYTLSMKYYYKQRVIDAIQQCSISIE